MLRNRSHPIFERSRGGTSGSEDEASPLVGIPRSIELTDRRIEIVRSNSVGQPTQSNMGFEMDMFRSEEMQLVQLIIPAESAHDTITYLGELGLLQFKDLNPEKSPFQRTYANQVKRCGEMARKLRYFRALMQKAEVNAVPRPAVDKKDLDLDELEVKLGELEQELLEMNANSEKLCRTRNELTELHLVLEKAGQFFTSARENATQQQKEMEEAATSGEVAMDAPLLEQEMQTDPTKVVRLGFVTGLVAKSEAIRFERILYRATRGNMFLKQVAVKDPVTDPASDTKVEKVVFVVFFAGERARAKVIKICEAFKANRYPFPEDIAKQRQMRTEVEMRISELQTTINAGNRHRDNVLTSIGYNLEQWSVLVRREKAVYHTLNMLSIDVTRKCLVAEGWCPIYAKPKIQDALQRAALDSNAQVGTIFQPIQTKDAPPTFFRVNKFTEAFQEIVESYGIGKYREANPAVFTIITFPFLFAIMFGDWGHGIMMLMAALYLVINEKKYLSQKLGDIMAMAFGGRYVILLMSIFSIYTGFIYNEFFSRPFPIFAKSAYGCNLPEDTFPNCSDQTTNGLRKVRNTYPFGVDPAWHETRTELPFLNSMKMKMSIIIGITQMMTGIILSLFNAKFFNQPLDVWYQFVPQVLFLGGLFGYLCFLIILKWISGSQADLYHVLIYMFLSPGSMEPENQLFPGQGPVQVILVLVAFISVPWMLFPKPLLLRKQHLEKMAGRTYGMIGASDTDSVNGDHEDDEHEEFEFGEIAVHQMIHTIEFVLGAVSNTASYLRLWALSLAHAELSAVFYERVLLTAFETKNIVAIVIGFAVFAFATIGVLLVMETLSAFLHALRLHWVEFQNKFYIGGGYKFIPFSFAAVDGEEE